jgi:hypothetical protein
MWGIYSINIRSKGGEVMNDIHVKVNLTVFVAALAVWVVIGVLIGVTMFEPSYDVPEPLSNLFATLTGVVLTTLTGFTKGASSDAKIDSPTPIP